MESNPQVHHEEEKKSSRTRYDHLRQIEVKMNLQHQESKIAEGQPLEGYESLTFEEKNKGKFFTTFPYPYMNGYLHLGK